MCEHESTSAEALEQARAETPLFLTFIQNRMRSLVLSVRPGDMATDSTAAIARELQYLSGAARNLAELLILFGVEAVSEVDSPPAED